jgi:hypothetical protein
MKTLTDEGDRIIGRRIVYVARKVSGPRLFMKSGKHRGMEGVLYDAEAYIDIAVQKKRTD